MGKNLGNRSSQGNRTWAEGGACAGSQSRGSQGFWVTGSLWLESRA